MNRYRSVTGTVTQITSLPEESDNTSDCTLFLTLQEDNGQITNFILTLTTCFTDNSTLRAGDHITAYYDTMQPVPLIYPPQFRAVVVAREYRHFNVTVDFFDSNLVNMDGTLKLNMTPNTPVLLPNRQQFLGTIGDRYLVVVYGSTTRSIPAITTPYQIIVLCQPQQSLF